ncbi:MAG: molybdopterin-guanine dinucleotide biosynthesis protein A [Gammaproteobacteria bacterium]|jgi:molybdopterin-guanine dinucleotide biosynthesis protein A
MNIKSDVTGVILAGGQARRMGGQDKGLVMLDGIPMVEIIIDVFKPQTAKLLINANRNHDRYAQYGLELVADELSGYCGPLAGMASALKTINTDYMVTAPCDSPFIPLDLVQRLADALENKSTEISVAHDGERIQPVFCMLKKTLLESLTDYLAAGERKIDRWFKQHDFAIADFSDKPETFDNINTLEDVESALSKLRDR